MKIGVLSDTHGDVERTQIAVDLFMQRNVATIVHCGDVGSTACIKVLGTAKIDVYLVRGNMDRQADLLTAAATEPNIHFARHVVTASLGGGEYLAATHGNNEDILEELILGKQFRYVCHGHTHRYRDEQLGTVHVINPGAIFRPRHPRYPTIALVDTDTDRVEQIALD